MFVMLGCDRKAVEGECGLCSSFIDGGKCAMEGNESVNVFETDSCALYFPKTAE